MQGGQSAQEMHPNGYPACNAQMRPASGQSQGADAGQERYPATSPEYTPHDLKFLLPAQEVPLLQPQRVLSHAAFLARLVAGGAGPENPEN